MSEAKRVPSLGKDDRNFRSKLYEKVGIQGVEERKTLETYWDEDPLNIDKFSIFALKYTIPSCERLNVWKVILGVTPRFAKNKEKYWKWKVLPYEDNLRFLKSAARITDSMPKAQSQTVLWLLFNNELKIEFKSQLTTEFWPSNFSAVCESMFKICENLTDVEVFYVSKGLVEQLRKFPNECINETVQLFHRLVANNDNTSKLYGHLEKIGFNEEIPIRSWICRGFAGILHESALEKIWDKVLGGSLKILAFVGAALIESTRITLTTCQTAQEAIRLVKTTSEEIDEKVAQTAIEMWIDDGSHIYPGEKPQKSIDRKLKQQQEQSSINLVEPNFTMATVIKIGPLEG